MFTARYELNPLRIIQANICILYSRHCVHCAVRAESLKNNSGEYLYFILEILCSLRGTS